MTEGNVHFGRGATVGSVITTRGTIIPAAIGVDIECGMHAVRLDRPAAQPTCRTTCGHAGCNRSAGTGRLRAAAEQTAGIECHKDAGVIDDIPGAYKPIDDVMEHENGLAVPVHRLRQVLNIKG